MARNRPKTILHRRRREQKTSYKKRLSLLVSRKPRVIIRFTNTKIIAQLVTFDPKGDLVQVGVDSTTLKKHGWNYSLKNKPAAYLTGVLFGKAAVAKGQKEGILDTGLGAPQKRGKTYAFLKGALDAGMNIPHGDDDIFPDEEKIAGKNIQDHAVKVKDQKEIYEKRFAQYLKNNVKPEEIIASFNKVKESLLQ